LGGDLQSSSGKLVLVVGPSGAGKDTLLRLAQATLIDHPHIVFQRRVVTRASGAWEDHDSMTPEDFAAANANGAFLLSWRAHDLDYGIPRAAHTLIDSGKVVVCNASRTVVTEAKRKLADARAVLVTAPADVLALRLAARGREAAITGRLSRTAPDVAEGSADFVIENIGAPEDGAARLSAYLTGLA
jgi:ribose 1,5-bisphosphokinase